MRSSTSVNCVLFFYWSLRNNSTFTPQRVSNSADTIVLHCASTSPTPTSLADSQLQHTNHSQAMSSDSTNPPSSAASASPMKIFLTSCSPPTSPLMPQTGSRIAIRAHRLQVRSPASSDGSPEIKQQPIDDLILVLNEGEQYEELYLHHPTHRSF